MAGAEDTIQQHYVDAFQAGIGMLPQQTTPRLIDCVDANLAFTTPGDKWTCDDMGSSEPAEITDRFGASPEGSVSRVRRVGFFVPFDDGKFVDDIDKAKSLSDPTNPTTMAMRAGLARHRDRVIITALGGAASEGRTGTTSVAFPASSQIAINDVDYYDTSLPSAPSGNQPLTLAKLIKAKVLLDAAELDTVDTGMPTIVASAKQLGALLRDRTVTSADWGAIKALINGEVNSFMGFNFVRSELLPLASSVRTCYAFKKNAMQYRGRMLEDVKIVQRSDRKFNWYAYYKIYDGAARRYDAGVLSIACTET